MAIKRECDRCKAVTTEHSIEKWKILSIDPLKPVNEYDRDGRWELCEVCVKRIYDILQTVVKV